MVKDLVCGMDVEPSKAAATSVFKGKAYYFCAKGCKVAFDRNPEHYIEGAEASGHERHQGHAQD